MNRGQTPPKPPPGRIVCEGSLPHREPTAAPPLFIELAIVLSVALAGLVVYALPDLIDWVAGTAPTTVHARALAGCRIPTEHEQLHIIVRERDGSLVGECMYVGARGTYGRRP